MNTLLEFVNSAIQRFGQQAVEHSRKEIDDLLMQYRTLSEAEFQIACNEAISGKIETDDFNEQSVFRKLRVIINMLRGRQSVDVITLRRVTLGIEAFNRTPADLPEHSRLYPQQIQAAIALTQSSIIQMDTGEGKTYALLPAAFALSCQHHRVYIVCANEYLAWRDASRTKNYWDSVGLSVGLCVEKCEANQWGQRIIYTTLQNIMFQQLHNELSISAPEYPTSYSALILDEADAILLDQAVTDYQIVSSIRSESYDWHNNIAIAQELQRDEHIVVNEASQSASLTTAGEEFLKQKIAVDENSVAQFLLIRQAVEIAYVALNLVQEDRDYIVDNGRVYPIDQATGAVRRNITHYWMMPLEYIRGFTPRDHTITTHSLSPRTFFEEFSHISGLSGTIQHDAIEYFISFHLPCIVIPPRLKRQQRLQEDLVYLNKAAAIKQAVELGYQAAQQGRPVLIGTQSIQESEEIYRIFKSVNDLPFELKLLSGKNEKQTAEIFAAAGNRSQITIATQLAGRGIDIRLSEAAKQAGGLYLISLGHATVKRYDRQFLGRAGRQGDPWDGVFVCSLEDELLRRFATERVTNFMKSLGMEDDEAIENAMVTRSIKNAQHKIYQTSFWERRHKEYLSQSILEIRPRIKLWFEYIHSIDLNLQDNPEKLSAFLDQIIKQFIDINLKTRLEREKDISQITADETIKIIEGALQRNIDKKYLNAQDLTGKKGSNALKTIQLALRQWFSNTLLQVNQQRALVTQISNLQWQTRQSIRSLYYAASSVFEAQHKVQQAELPSMELDSNADDLDPDPNAVAAVKNPYFGYSCHLDNEAAVKQETLNLENLKLEFNDFCVYPNSQSAGTAQSENGPDSFYQAIEQAIPLLEQLKSLLLENQTLEISTVRTPQKVAAKSVQLIWADFLEQVQRLKHQVLNSNYTTMEAYRTIYDRVISEWERHEADLPATVLRNLSFSGQVKQLDDLFWLDDHQSYQKSPLEKERNVYHWDSSQSIDAEKAPRDVQDISANLVDQFIGSAKFKPSEYFSLESLRQLLLDFLREAPINTLQSPGQIQNAIERWYVREVNQGLTTKRRKLNHYWIKQFLLDLNKKRRIGALPALQHKIKSLGQRFANSFGNIKTAISLASSILFLIMFVGLSFWQVGETTSFQGYAAYFETLFFGNLLEQGKFTAPVFSSILISMLAIRVLLPNQAASTKGTGLDLYLTLLLSVAIAIWLVPWQTNDFQVSTWVYSGFVCIAAVLFANFSKNIIWSVENEFGLSLINAWLCYTAMLVLWQNVFSQYSDWTYLAPITAGAFVFQLIFHSLNYVELALVSSRIKDHQMHDEEVNSLVKIDGNCGLAPYCYALLFSIVVHQFCWALTQRFSNFAEAYLIYINGLSILSYLITLFACNTVIINKRLSQPLWQDKLNRNRQMIKDHESNKGAAQYLNRVRKRLLTREQLRTTLLVGLMAWLLWDMPDINSQFPLSLIIIFLVSVIAYLGKGFAVELYKIFFSRAPTVTETLDLSVINEPANSDSFFDRVQEILKNRIYVIITLLILIIKGAELLVKGWGFFKTI